MTKQAKHMRNNGYNKGNASKKGRIVALALAGVLALGGAGAICMTTIGRSPGQPAAVTQTTTAATKKAETKNNTNQAVTKASTTKASTKQAETKNNTKPASTKQAETKKARQQNNQQQKQNTQKQQSAQPAPKPQPKPAPAPQPKPQQAPEPVRNESANMEAKYSADQCIAIACSHVGAGGAAKGEALNVTCSGLTNGGGTLYYTVELDLGDMHYKVTVDAIDGKVISGDATHMGTTNPIDENGDVMDVSALPEK